MQLITNIYKGPVVVNRINYSYGHEGSVSSTATLTRNFPWELKKNVL